MVNFPRLRSRSPGVAQPMAVGQLPARREAQGGQHKRKGRRFGGDWQPGQRNTVDYDRFGCFFRPAGGIFSREIDDEPHHRHRLEFDAPNPKSMNLDHARQCLRRPHDQPPGAAFQIGAVVVDVSGIREIGQRTKKAHHIAGSRTMKRAPRTRGSSVRPATVVRFSTRIVPPWASMICLEMDRPRPEFCPKPCSGRSV
jgi:hypothetical protein